MRRLQQLSWLTLAAVAGMGLSACRPAPAPTAEENITNELVQPTPLPVADSLIDRERLLTFVARAASAYAAGADNSEADRALDGRRFEVRLRFGCGQPAVGEDVSGWAVDGGSKTLRLKAVPDLSFDDPLIRSLAGREGVEAVEGFWLKRPWLLTDACPAPRASDAKVPPPKSQPGNPPIEQETVQIAPRAPRIGIAQFFTTTDSRARRRSARPYETVKPLENGSELGAAGFNLVLSGRLTAGPAGRVIACGSASIDTWPDCIIFADIDQVRMERPEAREVIADWAN